MVHKKPESKLKKADKDLGISKRISLIRSHFKLTADKMGVIAGVTGTAIANIEGGHTKNPGAEMLSNISTKLDVNLNWLVLGEGEMLKPDLPTDKSYKIPASDPAARTEDPAVKYKPERRYIHSDTVAYGGDKALIVPPGVGEPGISDALHAAGAAHHHGRPLPQYVTFDEGKLLMGYAEPASPAAPEPAGLDLVRQVAQHSKDIAELRQELAQLKAQQGVPAN